MLALIRIGKSLHKVITTCDTFVFLILLGFESTRNGFNEAREIRVTKVPVDV